MDADGRADEGKSPSEPPSIPPSNVGTARQRVTQAETSKTAVYPPQSAFMTHPDTAGMAVAADALAAAGAQVCGARTTLGFHHRNGLGKAPLEVDALVLNPARPAHAGDTARIGKRGADLVHCRRHIVVAEVRRRRVHGEWQASVDAVIAKPPAMKFLRTCSSTSLLAPFVAYHVRLA
jgi:hypothetical protein